MGRPNLMSVNKVHKQSLRRGGKVVNCPSHFSGPKLDLHVCNELKQRGGNANRLQR